MRRQDRYPDTSVFHFHNENPKNRFTTDCNIRAISTACNIPYNEVVMQFAQLQCTTGYDASSPEAIDRLLKQLGWVKQRQPRKPNNRKYTGKEFCQLIQRLGLTQTIIANIGGCHIAAIVNGRIYDIWDSSCRCIGNYWVRENEEVMSIHEDN